MGMGFAPTWLCQVSPPPLHKTTLTTDLDVTDLVCRHQAKLSIIAVHNMHTRTNLH